MEVSLLLTVADRSQGPVRGLGVAQVRALGVAPPVPAPVRAPDRRRSPEDTDLLVF